MHKEQGFTLIELMIVVVVISILSAIAFPSYQSYVRRGACEDGKGVLQGAANVLERYRAQHNTYSSAKASDLVVYQSAPVDGTQSYFSIALSGLSDTGYSLTATVTATGVLAGTGTLTLNSTGARSGTGALAGAWGSCSGI